MNSNWLMAMAVSCVVTLGLTSEASAEAGSSDADRGLAIARQMEAHDAGWGDSTSAMRMVLLDKDGRVNKERRMRVRALEVADDGDRSLIIFDEPKDVQGTVFLTHSHAVGSDDQWIYLPAFKRVKRIASSNKSGSFMSSEYAYEDLSSFEVERFSYEYLRQETLDGKPMHVVRTYPRYDHSGYKFRDMWVDDEHYRVRRMEYFDRSGKPLKTLTCHDFAEYLGQYWRAERCMMTNLQSGVATELKWSDFKFGTGLKDQDFSHNVMKRVR